MKATFDLKEYTSTVRKPDVWRPVEGGVVQMRLLLEASPSHDALVLVGGRIVMLGELERAVKAMRVASP